MNQSIIFFDGFCNLCNSFINFIIDTDKKRIYRYSSLQSLEGQKLVKSIGQTPYNYKSLILVQNNMMYQKSTAVLKIFRELSFPWNLGYYFKIIPTFIRDYVYSIIASNRYNLFGKRNTCRVPNDEEKQLSMDLTGGMIALQSENISEKSKERLIAHFDRILDLNMIRTDGSVRQCAIFDSSNNFSHYSTNHGYEVFDSVAKTHASTMLNFISVYEITGHQRFLNQTIKLANYWCDSIPEDWVPRYDFTDPDPNTKPKDSCAASIAVVAMIRLCKIRPELNAHYRLVIEETLKTLSKKYLAEGGILLHSSWGDQRWHSALKFEPIPSNLVFPQEEILPFGNYFFVEAIFRELKPDENI